MQRSGARPGQRRGRPRKSPPADAETPPAGAPSTPAKHKETPLEFIAWLRAHNDALPAGAEKVGFYGLDLYSLHASMKVVLQDAYSGMWAANTAFGFHICSKRLKLE